MNLMIYNAKTFEYQLTKQTKTFENESIHVTEMTVNQESY